MFIKAALLVFPCLWTLASGENECQQIDVCRCRLNNGSEINLHRLDHNGSPRFQVSQSGKTIIYSPCKGLTCGQGVTNSSICLSDDKKKSSLGYMPSFQFEYDKTGNIWNLKYVSKDKKVKSTVHLNCSPKTQFDEDEMSNATHYWFGLSSPCVCPDGCVSTNERPVMSTGTVLLLVFFSLLLVYFGVGSLYRKSVYGAEGRNIIPHNSFWFSLPGLIRDGYLFFISPCLGERVEYRYYDRL